MAKRQASEFNTLQGDVTVFKPIVAYLEWRRIEMVKRHVSGYLLDVGCGLNRLVREYGHGVGIDVHNWHTPAQLVGDGAALPFRDSSFDTVSFLACLNHIPHREQALCEAWRVLRPGGLLLVTMIGPTISLAWHNLLGVHRSDQHQRGGVEDGEVWGLKVSEMVGLVQEAGFQPFRRKTFIFGINNLYLARKAPE